MANYRFKTAEIEAMKKNILTHCKYEREPDRHGNKSAWRLRLVLEGYVMCCRCSKREEARRLRELALYEKLTENDLPNWQSEPTQPATPTETPRISTETAKTVNVSAEGEKEAERPQYRVWRFAKPNYAQIIVSDYSQWKVVAVLSFVWGKTQIEVSDDVANIHTIGKKELTIDKPLTELTDAEVLELIYNHTEPPQSPETGDLVLSSREDVLAHLDKLHGMEYDAGEVVYFKDGCTAEEHEDGAVWHVYPDTESDEVIQTLRIAPQMPETPQTVERTTDTPKPRETARKPQNRGIGCARMTRHSGLGAGGYEILDNASATLAAMSVPRECSTADATYW